MGNIIFASLEFATNQKKTELNVVVKLMKPQTSATRMRMDSDYQFINEVFVYRNVIPTFLAKFEPKFKKIEKNLRCPQVYLAETGKFPALGDATETLLAMENLTEKGFRLGPRIDLTSEELMLMTTSIAEYHACTYALRINRDPDLEKLINEIRPFKFGNSAYNWAYSTALERLFTYLDTNPAEMDSESFGRDLIVLRTKYSADPVKLMSRFLRTEPVFSVILHGDYNRNNVLFKYDENGVAVDLRFIDFQEVKYGSPAIDLSFFMYMNMYPSLFDYGLNEKLVRLYHETLVESLCELLDCNQQDVKLSAYRWDNFYENFKQFALYGAMVATLFIPWMACTEDECSKLAKEFERDMYSDEMKRMSLTCGGEEVDKRIVAVLRNASKLGFMEMLTKDD